LLQRCRRPALPPSKRLGVCDAPPGSRTCCVATSASWKGSGRNRTRTRHPAPRPAPPPLPPPSPGAADPRRAPPSRAAGPLRPPPAPLLRLLQLRLDAGQPISAGSVAVVLRGVRAPVEGAPVKDELDGDGRRRPRELGAHRGRGRAGRLDCLRHLLRAPKQASGVCQGCCPNPKGHMRRGGRARRALVQQRSMLACGRHSLHEHSFPALLAADAAWLRRRHGMHMQQMGTRWSHLSLRDWRVSQAAQGTCTPP